VKVQNPSPLANSAAQEVRKPHPGMIERNETRRTGPPRQVDNARPGSSEVAISLTWPPNSGEQTKGIPTLVGAAADACATEAATDALRLLIVYASQQQAARRDEFGIAFRPFGIYVPSVIGSRRPH
jgi:hypothetical protein